MSVSTWQKKSMYLLSPVAWLKSGSSLVTQEMFRWFVHKTWATDCLPFVRPLAHTLNLGNRLLAFVRPLAHTLNLGNWLLAFRAPSCAHTKFGQPIACLRAPSCAHTKLGQPIACLLYALLRTHCTPHALQPCPLCEVHSRALAHCV